MGNDPNAQQLLNFLNQGLVTRAQIVNTILNSTEYRNRLITAYYSKYLNRSASGPELSAWRGSLASGATDEAVIAAILASDEYFLRVTPPHIFP